MHKRSVPSGKTLGIRGNRCACLTADLHIGGASRILKRTNKAILNAQAQLVSSEKKREALEVRTHIARDVHDQLGSELTKLVMLSGEAKAMAQTIFQPINCCYC
ncbi:MAG: hypothetical protein IPI91_16285 [Flavobacteriales bacterium]|nr:hypothetical protein [Flavobacteriales bacterium]